MILWVRSKKEGDDVEFSVKLEAVALVLIAILALFHFGGQTRNNMRSRMYSACLILTAASTALDIVTTLTILDVTLVPLWANILLNTLYFAVMDICLSLIAFYSFYVLFEHVSDKHCLYIAARSILGMCAFLLGTVVLNLWNGCLFYFQDGVYIRGLLNRIGYIVLMIELCMLCACYFRNRKVASMAMRKLIQAVPPLVVLFVLIQMYVPDILLNGTMAAMVNLIFYINFQSNRIYQDTLTGLPNRSLFCQELAIRRRKRQRLHLIMVHLENLDNVNRKFGITTGDNVLFVVANFLSQISPEYQAFRFGNTRFLLMGNFTAMKNAEETVEKTQKYFAEPLEELNREFVLEAGIAHMIVYGNEGDENSIIDQLEYAVSDVKEALGSNLVYFDERVQQMFERKEYVLKMIRKALEEESFQIYYQPVFNCITGTFTTAESLLRLFGERGEMIGPNEFILLAEENGLMDEISWLVLKKVCRFLSEHPQLPLKTVSINMSIQQLENRNFIQKIRETREQYGISPDRICIEITERVMADNPRLVSSVMEQMAKEGIGFYLDDFGIGYSNLASVLSLPLETVKLDSSLLKGIEKEGKMCEVVRLLILMLHHAGFRVVSEGIETQEQAERVKELQVDRIQGYFYSRPLSEEKLLEFMEA